jgi:hypothetical protein
MDCRDAQERILELLEEGLMGGTTPDLETHVAGCEICRAFSETQVRLDHQLSAMLSGADLSPAFRASLTKRIRHEPLAIWPEYLPDVAHVVGGACATALCMFLLPFPAAVVLLDGVAFTLVTYFIHTVLEGVLDALEE